MVLPEATPKKKKNVRCYTKKVQHLWVTINSRTPGGINIYLISIYSLFLLMEKNVRSSIYLMPISASSNMLNIYNYNFTKAICTYSII